MQARTHNVIAQQGYRMLASVNDSQKVFYLRRRQVLGGDGQFAPFPSAANFLERAGKKLDIEGQSWNALIQQAGNNPPALGLPTLDKCL